MEVAEAELEPNEQNKCLLRGSQFDGLDQTFSAVGLEVESDVTKFQSVCIGLVFYD